MTELLELRGNLIWALLLIPPWVLTALNLWNLFAECSGKRKLAPRSFAGLSLGIGAVEYFLLLCAEFDYSGKDYDQATYAFQTHNLIDSAYALSFWLPFLAGIMGLVLLLWCRPEQLPPLVSAGAVAGVLVGNIMQILLAAQLTEQIDFHNFLDWYFYLYHGNLLLLSAMGIRRHIAGQTRLLRKRQTVFRRRWVLQLYQFLEKTSHFRLTAFLLVLPLAAVLEIVLILCGQGADGTVQAFTQTADWTFSQQLPPPPLEYQGHYLCTVAAGGHRKLVRPLRLGHRRGAVIVVNRQLAVANAFEELLQERLPCLHRRVRQFYDTHGYPLSQKITTPFRADLVYLLMKPLEWLFVVVLYLFDLAPECRIARQYTAGKPVKNWSEKTYADIRN
ncbi:DUF6688 domain-containing protein [Ruminococcus callidus]